MKREMMDILVCPVCKGKLSLNIDKEKGEEIESGFLYCATCNISYLIKDTIPHLLPPDHD